MSNIKIIKRDGLTVDFDKDRIEQAILKSMKNGSGIVEVDIATSIANACETHYSKEDIAPTVHDIEDYVYNALIEYEQFETAKAYEGYRAVQEFKREVNTSDEGILKLINEQNEDVMRENSNKNQYLNSTQRDLISGEVSKDITMRKLIPAKIVQAHREGILHWHDMDYTIQKMTNCCLVNLQDMLDNGTVINDKLVETPQSFETACTVTTQIMAQVASSQYGGQSITIKHLAPYLRKSYDKEYKYYIDEYNDEKLARKEAGHRRMKALKDGVQTIRYQLSTLQTTNGQSPFATIYLEIVIGDEYECEMALICEEMIKQRLEGMKNYKGQGIGEAFPKLVYLLDEHNCLNGGKYDYITKLCAKCNAKRLVPDYQSAKILRSNYEGGTFPPMGCVDGKEIITYKYKDKLYVESFERMWNRLGSDFEIRNQKAQGNYYIDLKDVLIFDTKKGFVETNRIIKNKDKRDWVRVKFSNGRSLLATEDHPLPIIDKGRVFVKDLEIGDKIVINQNQYAEETIKYDINKSWLLGFILCDGCYDYQLSSSIASTEEDDIEERYKKVFKETYGVDVETVLWNRGERGNYKELKVKSGNKDIRLELVDMFGGLQKIHRQIPNEVFSWDRDSKLSFLAGMIDADGHINSTVQIGSTNKELALQTMALSQSLGLPTKVYLNHYTSKDRNKIRYRIEFTATVELLRYMSCDKKINCFTREANITQTHEAVVTDIEKLGFLDKFSYDVTTESDHFEVSGIYSHNCRSHLSPYKDEDGEYKWYGRFNQGVVSINLPQIGIIADKDFDLFWKMFDERLELCKEALLVRHNLLLGTKSDVAPILWQYGGLARLKKGEVIDKLLYDGYSSISLGYIGLYELVVSMLGISHTTEEGEKFALEIMNYMRCKCDKWKKETNIGFSLYGSPAENTVYRFCRIDKQKFGEIPSVTDKLYYTNSYHVNVQEEIDAFSKLKFESQFHSISSGGCISYVEVPDMSKNLEAVEQLIKFIYDNVQYAEINTKPDLCYKCGYSGEMQNDANFQWYCPNCGNNDESEMQVMRRTCGLTIGSR